MRLSDVPRIARRIAGVRGTEWGIVVHGFWLTVLVELGLRCVSIGTLLAWSDRRASRPQTPDHAGLTRLAQLAGWPSRLLRLPSTCLRRSLVLSALLNRRGIESRVRLGVRRQAAVLEAHAWVECGGWRVGEGPGRAFEPLPRPRVPVSRSVRWWP